MNNTLGYVHFFVTIVGSYAIFFPMHFMRAVPRRYYTYSNFDTFDNFQGISEFISIAAIVVFAAQILFVINFFYSAIKGRRMTEDKQESMGSYNA